MSYIISDLKQAQLFAYQDPEDSQPYSTPSSFWNSVHFPLSKKTDQSEIAQEAASQEIKSVLPSKELKPYEELIKDKAQAFFFFTKHVETRNILQKSDVEEFERLKSNRRTLLTFLYFGTCFAAIAGDKALRRKFLLYGMTHRSSTPKTMLKFWLLPTVITSLCSETFGEWRYGTEIKIL